MDQLQLFDVLAVEPAGDGAPPLDECAAVLPIDDAVERRFWQRVVKSSTCWWWVGAISTPDGYGRITWRRKNHQRALSAHRFALTIAAGAEIADEAVAEHLCNQPLCVRVGAGHLQVGTQAENVAYAVATGRHRGPRLVSATNRCSQSLAVRAYLLGGGDPDKVGQHTSRIEPTLF
ncbi:MAG: hypothetical protein WAW85_07875 [Gordonia sp. (in: high G+C Gram-positive bacteria)]|uniref:hypothetical protein n=1 Tax=Gordonia sp. (in: high G+C Gram-positive bacteria) TaxID=84139 RepID=UPI003BB768BA